MSPARKKAYIALIGNTIFWGAALPVVKLALPYTTPFRFLFYRFAIASFISLPLLLHYLFTKYKLSFKQFVTIAILESVIVVELGLLYEGLKRTSALDASLIGAAGPVFVVIAGIWFLHEKEERREWLGLLLAVLGTLIITIEPLFNGFHESHSSFLGNTMVLVRGLVWAGYVVIAKRIYRTIPKILITMISFWVGMICFGIFSYIATPSFLFADLSNGYVLFASVYMATFGSIIGATLYLYGQGLIEVSEATLFGYLQPFISVPLAIAFFGDKLKLLTIVGSIIVAVGVYLAEKRTSKV